MSVTPAGETAPRMAVHRLGRGPDLLLFHGGMGSWRHWVRNVEALAAHYTVHALDHPSYGASAPVPRETTGRQYLDLMHELVTAMLPGDAPLRLAGFSFGGAIAANLARRLGGRVTHVCLVSPAGFPARRFGERPIRSYKEAGGDERKFREICRHNLLVNMLSDPASVTEEAIDIQAEGVRRARFDSRKVSAGGTLLGDLAQATCAVRVLWGVGDDSAFRPADLLLDEIRAAVDGTADIHRIPAAGHWSAYENAPEVNRLMLEFFARYTRGPGASPGRSGP
jgi:pimeloyl-ACP methyl ester carboxylesterase